MPQLGGYNSPKCQLRAKTWEHDQKSVVSVERTLKSRLEEVYSCGRTHLRSFSSTSVSERSHAHHDKAKWFFSHETMYFLVFLIFSVCFSWHQSVLIFFYAHRFGTSARLYVPRAPLASLGVPVSHGARLCPRLTTVCYAGS